MTAKPKILNTPEVGRGSLHVYCGDLQRDGLQLCKKRMGFTSKERVVNAIQLRGLGMWPPARR